MNENALCWLNGKLLPLSEAALPVNDHGLLYGDGVFEGIRIYQRRPFRLLRHLERLARSARAIALTIPFNSAELTEVVEQMTETFAADNGYIRLVVTRGSGSLGLNPKGCERPNVIVIADQLSMIDQHTRERGARLIVASVRRPPADSLDPRIKSLNYLNHILAKIEANHAGADEAILLNTQGRVAEGTADNVFIVRGDCLLTPPCSEGALEGITRELVLELAEAADLRVKEIPLGIYDLYTADECFLTGTGAELIPVASIDQRIIAQCPGPVFKLLKQRFTDAVTAECGGMMV